MIALEFDRVSRDFTTPDGRGYRALDDVPFCMFFRTSLGFAMVGAVVGEYLGFIHGR